MSSGGALVVTNQNHVFVRAKSEITCDSANFVVVYYTTILLRNLLNHTLACQIAQPVSCLWNKEPILSDHMKTQESIQFYSP